MSTLQQVELGVLGPLQVRQYGLPVSVPGAKPRAILTMLGLHGGSIVSAETLVELLWGDEPPRTAAKALPTHISTLRRTLGDGIVLTAGTGWTLGTADVDATRYTSAAKLGRDALSAGDPSQAVSRFDEALGLWRDTPELPDGSRGLSERTRWLEDHAALVEDRADALLATGRAAEIIGELEAAISDAPLRERRWGQLMLALYRAGRQGEALGAYQRARALLADELGVDPGPDLRKLEAAIVAQDSELEVTVPQQLQTSTRTVTFLLTDIEGSTAAWEANADAMAVALARHDELVEQVVTSRGGRLIKTRGEGDATFSVFDRASAAATSAIELQEAIRHEPWALHEPIRIRVSLHTGEVELRDGDYFGRAVNRAARLRSLAAGGQTLCSGATAELVIDSLPDDVVLADLGSRQLKNLARPEHVFELRLETAYDASTPAIDKPMERPILPAVLAGRGPFVGRGRELEGLLAAWQTTLSSGTHAVLIAGEPGVGKTRLAGEWARQAYELGAVVLYGRCDEDLGAPYQPFSEALRSLVPSFGLDRLRGLRGVKALPPLIPGLADDLPDLVVSAHADADTERYALFDAVVALLGAASASAPVVVILDDLHWAAKPTLLLLRHLLRFGEHARVQIVGTYRSTDLDRSHPLAAMLADLHRDGSADRVALNGLEQDDITAYVAEAGYDDEELAKALAAVTGGNPFFLIEALRHVDESGGRWDPRTLPQGVREAVSRRLSRLSEDTNTALAAAAVVGTRFSLDLVERVTGEDLIDAFDEASKAGIVIEEPGGLYRFNHALVRQSLLAELASVRRMRLHQRIAATLEAEPGANDEVLAELAYHYFECAWAGNAAKAVEYCRRAADQAMARLAYEGAAEQYDRALHALDELDDELPDRDDVQAELLIARLEALLAAGDVVSAAKSVSKLQAAAHHSARLAAWGTCFDGQLSMLTHPEQLDEIESALATAAEELAGLDDAAGEAKAHTVRASCLARLGRIADAEAALDRALTAARRAHDHRRVNAVLANAPLAALWGPNPVPRAGGRCLDVVRLLRITTGSAVVEATSTRCQAVLDAFRGRAAAGRRLIDSARRELTELGMRHALLEVEQFAGIIELVADDPAAAELHLRRAYDGFRRMGLDVDTAETAALLARVCLALDRAVEADELCTESQHLAGHALKASMGWRSVRAQLLARAGDQGEAERVAEEAVRIAEGTDALVDHGDACLALATVLFSSDNSTGARAAAERAASLYEAKGAAALAEKARRILGGGELRTADAASPDGPVAELDNECWRVAKRAMAAINREALEEAERLWAPDVLLESRRKIVGFTGADLPPDEWFARRALGVGGVRVSQALVAIRGERLALTRTSIGTTDVSPGAPSDEFLRVFGIDQQGRIALEVWFDLDDIDAAIAELDAAYARLELDNACTRAISRLDATLEREAWDEFEHQVAPVVSVESRRKLVGIAPIELPYREWVRAARSYSEVDAVLQLNDTVAIRGERLALSRIRMGIADPGQGAPRDEMLMLWGLDEHDRISTQVWFDVDDMDAAIAELDAAYARLGDRPRAPLENAASRAEHRLNALFAERRWDEIDALLANDLRVEERRLGLSRESGDGAKRMIAEARVIADLGVRKITSEPVATRGERLVLSHVRFSGRAPRPDAFRTDVFRLTEVGDDGLVVSFLTSDIDDLDTAIAELDARYLAGEAAPNANEWQTVLDALGELNRHEFGPVLMGLTFHNHRRASFASEDYGRAAADLWTLVPDAHYLLAEVYELDAQGAVLGLVVEGTDTDGTEVQWAGNISWMFRQSRADMYEADDLDAALARFKELHARRPRLENAASRVGDRYFEHFAARDWDGLADDLAEDLYNEDHRLVVNSGTRHGRDSELTTMRAAADLGITNITAAVMATRGQRLVLSHVSGHHQGSEGFVNSMLGVVEINSYNRIATIVTFEADDIDAAFAELDARYLAGEAAAHAHTWSHVSKAYAALDRHELPATTTDWVNVDHRRISTIESGEMTASIRASWDLFADISWYIEAVHQLSDRGAVFTQVAQVTSQDGFEAEAREIALLTVHGNLIDRCEIFDAADLDAAIARFNELSQPVRRLDNAAARADHRLSALFVRRQWDEIGALFTENVRLEDKRRGLSNTSTDRATAVATTRAIADVGTKTLTYRVLAIRGERLALARTLHQGRDTRPDAFQTETLTVTEVNDDGLIATLIAFDANDIDTAIAELEARYLAGEATAHARTWSVIARGYAALNRRELPPTTSDLVDIDHRRGATAFAPGDLTAYVQALFDMPDIGTYVGAVHRLSDLGAVITHVGTATSHDGFDAEWRIIIVMTVKGDLINRAELFDESDLDAALAKFDELSHPAHRLENAASKAYERLQAHFAARDWDTIAEFLADDIVNEDRRRVVNQGMRLGRDATVDSVRATADLGVTSITATVLATRGTSLALTRDCFSVRDQDSEAFAAGVFDVELLGIVEIDAQHRIKARVAFDLDDIDAAFAELESRYLAGEAAPYAQTWSVIAGAYAALNRRGIPATTSDWATIDHRRISTADMRDLPAFLQATWELMPHASGNIVAVHRLNNLGAVVTQASHAISPEGFVAEWREITVSTVEGHLVKRCELFDESDLDAALAMFDELDGPARELENTASRFYERYRAAFAAHDWDTLAEMIPEDATFDDRRSVVNSGVQHGRDALMQNLRAIADLGFDTVTWTVVATRGKQLILTRDRWSVDQEPEAFWADTLKVIEIDADGRMVGSAVQVDADDTNSAFAELESRYLAGEAAEHARTWSVIAGNYAAFNRHEFPSTTPDWVTIDHRRTTSVAPDDLPAFIRSVREDFTHFAVHIEAVHRLSQVGAVITQVSKGISHEGFEAEWRELHLCTIDGEQFTRSELFDESDLDVALARFDELDRPPQRLENAASRIEERFNALFTARDWAAMTELLTDDTCYEDRRRVVNAGAIRGRDAQIGNLRAVVDVGAVTHHESNVIAIRGERFALTRTRVSGSSEQAVAWSLEILTVVEVDSDHRIAAGITFDLEDIDAAIAELDNRYAAGDAAAYARTWGAVVDAIAAFNRGELPDRTPNFAFVDHRQFAIIETGALDGYARAAWDQTPGLCLLVESVHLLTGAGSVFAISAQGTSQDGFDAEWRMIELLMLEGDLVDRIELFDEGDLDVARARFEELSSGR